MIPLRITLENFLTFAGPVEFDFTGDEPLWVIGGPNGVGKSAVFDAVTLALFGVHRGGMLRMDELVRHGADSFRVTLEFEFAGTEYRVTRAFSGSKQLAPKLESRPPGGTWATDRRVNKVNHLTPIIERLLGLGYETFTKSVLLKQGEADKLFKASREERAAILKGIIGFEQYEAVSARVHETTTEAKGSHEQLKRQFDGLTAVEAEELTNAECTAAKASEELRTAREGKEAVVQRVERAKQWVRLDAIRLGLERQCSDADERLRDAEEIRAGKQRLDELEGVVPHCESLLDFRTKLVAAEVACERLKHELAEATRCRDGHASTAREKRLCAAGHKEQADAAELRNKELVPVIAERKRWHRLANEVQKLADDLSGYPKDLSEQHLLAKTVEERVRTELTLAEKDFTQAETLLGVAIKEDRSFADVKIGASCPHCRQPVSELHAAEFRRQLQDKLAHLHRTKGDYEEKKRAASETHKCARTAVTTLGTRVAERSRIETTFTTKKECLEREGGSVDVAVLTREIARLEDETRTQIAKAAAQRRLQGEVEGEAARVENEASAAEETIRATNSKLIVAGQEVANLSGRRDEVAGRIPAAWVPFAATLSETTLGPLKAELSVLEQSKVATRFEQLAKDRAERSGWETQLATTREDIVAIPELDRVAEATVAAALRDAAARVEGCDAAAGNAAASLRDLKTRSDTYITTARDLGTAERRAGLLRKLDDLLGEKGLQRELVRAAEHEVVSLADDTLRQLSHQELSIEPDTEATGRADKAFALRVRKAGDPNPIRIDFISGSQKFRVAVALALAIGRFAAGKQRPIEAVIIDEGFGSLDEEGLRAMAENLNELRRSQSLKRILLVSHQKNFTDQFTNGYVLAPCATGTTATRIQ